MRETRLRALAVTTFVVSVVTGACGRPAYPVAIANPLLGKPLPEIHHRQTLDGRPFDSAELAGRPVLVKFFADYCEPCKRSLPAAERVHEAHPEVSFIGIDEDETPEAAVGVAQRYGLTFAVVHDRDNVLSGRFRVSTMPMTFVADATGTIRWVGGEEQTEDSLRLAVEAAR
jgi:thiol-disulfide isomerase/thioredoxin